MSVSLELMKLFITRVKWLLQRCFSSVLFFHIYKWGFIYQGTDQQSFWTVSSVPFWEDERWKQARKEIKSSTKMWGVVDTSMSLSLCPWWSIRGKNRIRNDSFLDFRLPFNITPQAAFPGEAKNTAGIKAIPYQHLFNRNLLVRYFLLFFTNSLCKTHCVKQSPPNTYIWGGQGELCAHKKLNRLNKKFKSRIVQDDTCLLA